MENFVLDAQASEIRTELMKERKRRFDAEARVRSLEQQLSQSSSLRNFQAQNDSRRQGGQVEPIQEESTQHDPSATPSASLQVPTTSSPSINLENGETASSRGVSPRRGEIFDLEAEREWLNSVKLPPARPYSRPSVGLHDSNGGSDLGSTAGDDVDIDRNSSEAASVDDTEASAAGSSSLPLHRSRFGNSEGLLTRSAIIGSSPILNGSTGLGEHKMSSYGSTASLQELSRRKFDETSTRLSSLRSELAEYKQVLAETSTQLVHAQNRSEYLETMLQEANESLALLRQQVREKNARILSLQEENRSVAILKTALDESSKVRLSLQVDLDVAQRSHQVTIESEEAIKKQVDQLMAQLKSKEADVSSKDAMMAKMAEKLMDLKLQLQIMVPHLCKFSVSTVVRFGKPVVVSIGVLKPNATKNQPRELEIVIAGKRSTHPASSVLAIVAATSHNERFTINYKNGNTDTFDSTRREEVVKELNLKLFSTTDDSELMDTSSATSTHLDSSLQSTSSSSSIERGSPRKHPSSSTGSQRIKSSTNMSE
jgi:hypothetical protein